MSTVMKRTVEVHREQAGSKLSDVDDDAG
jgi:hypothetical protein